ncbi:MAG: zinc-ribbon domain-containing protein [Lachnospiraceae bacterium]|nr:zinc-ribbon domain-containing protein [Lachnospiraceae bacterium]
MFCSNCGYELPDGVQFCSKCGTRIRNGDLVVVKEEEFENNAPVSAKFENITVQNQFSERVNSELFADRRSQNKLFSVYAELIAPVKKIEGLTESIKSCDEQIAYLRDEKNAEIAHGCLSIVVATVVGFPLGAIVGFQEKILDYSFLLGYSFMFLFPVLLTFVFRIIWKLTYGQIYKRITYKENLKKADALENMRDDLLKERDAVCFAEKDKLMYVPKKYRYSGAISYFVDLYNSSRVDTLKEAVNAYAHDKQVAEKLKLLSSQIDVITEFLGSIEEI